MRSEWLNHGAAITEPNLDASRRHFIKASGAIGAGLVLGFFIGATRFAVAAAGKTPSSPHAFLRIAPDDSITVLINRLEFGQGVHTALPMLIAEELDADWAQMRAELAPAAAAYRDPLFGIQMTGGSGSINHSFNQYREIGAAARAMLIAAAASRWQVAPSACRTARGVVHGPAGQALRYGELADAAMQLPLPQKVVLKDPKNFRLIGRPTPRLDARAKSSGLQSFGIDTVLPNMKVAVVARPPVFGASIAKLDSSAALQVPGVLAVFEIDTDRGGRGIAVIGTGYWPAKQGRDALKIDWNSAALEKIDSTKQLAAYRELARKPGLSAKKADLSTLASAPKKITAEFEFPYLAHAPMEPLNCSIDLRADACTVWVGSQFQTIDQAAIARTAGLPPEQVTLHTTMAGGGFGRRAVPTSDYLVEAVNVAKAWRASGQQAPIKVIWSREDDIRGGYYRPMHVHRAELGLNDDGRIVGWNHVIVGQSILHGTPFESMMVKDGVDATMIEGMGEPYDVPLNLSVHNVVANVPVLWWRSVGSTHTAFVMETLIDEAAQLAGVDAVDYRQRLLGKQHARHRAALDLAVAQSGYRTRQLPTGHAWGVAMHESFQSIVAYVVTASIVDGKPRLHSVTAGVHCNRAVNPLSIEAQIQGAALMALGTTLPGAAITLKDGVVEQSNFHDYSVARMTDMPQIAVHIVASTDAPTGIGEPGLPPLAPALANALFRLTGKRLRKLPFDLAAA